MGINDQKDKGTLLEASEQVTQCESILRLINTVLFCRHLSPACACGNGVGGSNDISIINIISTFLRAVVQLGRNDLSRALELTSSLFYFSPSSRQLFIPNRPVR
jgi:hypothetical protein